jgi:hypothetical protein
LSKNEDGYNALYFASSLVHDYEHLGFNQKLESKLFTNNNNHHGNISESDENSSVNYQRRWLEKIKAIMVTYEIKILFIRDKIDKDLLAYCLKNSVLVFQNLAANLSRKIVEYFDCQALVYLEDFEPHHLFKLNFKIINSNKLCQTYANLVRIQEENAIFNYKEQKQFVTVLIETRLQNTREYYEESLNHCLKRVHNILNNRCYLHGNGLVEQYLSENIVASMATINEDTNDENKIYFEIVKEAFCYAFRDFHSLILLNDMSIRKPETNEKQITYDDYSSKIEACKLATLINKFLLNTDCSIVY